MSFLLSYILIASSIIGMEQALLVQDDYAASPLSAILSEVLQMQGFAHEIIAPEKLVSRLSDTTLLEALSPPTNSTTRKVVQHP